MEKTSGRTQNAQVNKSYYSTIIYTRKTFPFITFLRMVLFYDNIINKYIKQIKYISYNSLAGGKGSSSSGSATF